MLLKHDLTTECDICHIQLHNNTNCFYKLANNKLCRYCYTRTKLNPGVEETVNEENWRGLNKKRKRKSYLEPSSEILSLDRDSKKVHTISLLRNGSVDNLKPVKVNGSLVVFQNTCGYDALSQLMAASFCDSGEFKEFINSNYENKWLSFIKEFVSKGISSKTYRLRGEILFNLSSKQILPENIITVNVETFITRFLTLLSPSITKSYICNACQLTTETENEAFLPVEMSTGNYQNLNFLLEEKF